MMLLCVYIIKVQLVHTIKVIADTTFRFPLYIRHDDSDDLIIRWGPLFSLADQFFCYHYRTQPAQGHGFVYAA